MTLCRQIPFEKHRPYHPVQRLQVEVAFPQVSDIEVSIDLASGQKEDGKAFEWVLTIRTVRRDYLLRLHETSHMSRVAQAAWSVNRRL